MKLYKPRAYNWNFAVYGNDIHVECTCYTVLYIYKIVIWLTAMMSCLLCFPEWSGSSKVAESCSAQLLKIRFVQVYH